MNSPDTVLVVEDDAGIRDLMASALSFAGFDVQLAEDVPQALTHLAQRPRTSWSWTWACPEGTASRCCS